jgi:hypothetical protein
VNFNIGALSGRVKVQRCLGRSSWGGTLRNNFLASLKMQILKSGALYFALVFGTGFVLGTIRVLLVVPRIGTRTAELIETPVMILVSFIVADGSSGVSSPRPQRQSELRSASLR